MDRADRLGGVNIAILTPTRGRPQRFAEMCAAINRTAHRTHGTLRVYAGLDEDDAGSYELRVGVTCLIRPRMRLAPWCNLLAEQALKDGADVLAFFGDDHRPRTPGWDDRVCEAFFRMGSGLVYCADGLQNERLPTAPFWSADVIRALGFYYAPVLQHLYADNYWLALAHDLDRCTYLPNVLVEHEHPSAGKAEMDDSYRESGALVEQDRQAFERFMESEHPAALERVRTALAGA
ncbi:MAG: hypothetical protein ACYCQK_01700 [Acidiferrobacteraceae bacterium]